MAGYHNVQLPTTFSRGSLFGPGYDTKIIELDSLQEQRYSRVPDSGRRRYDPMRCRRDASFTHTTNASTVACTSRSEGKVGARRMLLSVGSRP